ncbi:hypothetical protein GO755_33685 [Spirosoma sp. HMF4905]|uniref:Uncharacterized protein n=1 Tax=Spirosoma arboris TaxID=2682092 RepID=A0A7K1SMM4_9BACT|nr:hypothetical protein [Spirosoma arboris]MVM35027.1 hypothetical protein [Spirosoma arboris]
MTIQFSQQEIEEIRRYFTEIDSGETPKQLHELHQEFPEWNTVFLLLRKLLAYGIYSGLQTGQEISYKELQTKTQKPETMLANVYAYFGIFDILLAAYTAHGAISPTLNQELKPSQKAA